MLLKEEIQEQVNKTVKNLNSEINKLVKIAELPQIGAIVRTGIVLEIADDIVIIGNPLRKKHRK